MPEPTQPAAPLKEEPTPVLDVHPPHEPIHGWRDFLLHILTITIGLFIALSLEGLVESTHHRHLLAEARENIHREIVENQQLLPKDVSSLTNNSARLKENILVLRQLREHPHTPHGQLHFNIAWSSFPDSAWRTARDTGALSYMPYTEVQQLSVLYGQQQYINGLGITLFTDQGKAPSLLAAESSLDDLQPAQLTELIARIADLSAQADLLQDLFPGLTNDFNEAAKMEAR